MGLTFTKKQIPEPILVKPRGKKHITHFTDEGLGKSYCGQPMVKLERIATAPDGAKPCKKCDEGIESWGRLKRYI